MNFVKNVSFSGNYRLFISETVFKTIFFTRKTLAATKFF